MPFSAGTNGEQNGSVSFCYRITIDSMRLACVKAT